MSTRQARGFTLIELLVVIAILGFIASLVGPSVLHKLSGAKSDTARLQIADFGAALDLYFLDFGRYPTTTIMYACRRLGRLAQAGTSVSSTRLNGWHRKIVPRCYVRKPWKLSPRYRALAPVSFVAC